MKKISVIGIGYVGLPVAVAFGRIRNTIGFDINPQRIQELNKGFDSTGEVTEAELKDSRVFFTSNIEDLVESNFYIIAVPTPVNDARQPDLTILLKASELVGKVLKPGDLVVYESTVYPGATEEDCVPVLEKISGLQCGKDFKVGYSPERINPGDKKHTFTQIRKVVSGQDQESLEEIASVYASVVEAGVFKAPSIKVAESAKVIENTQRDLNIALMNELALIFHKMDIDTLSVLEAAGTKWNFLPFRPGLVGGHCIGVDPYYLTHKAEKIGHTPQVILAGRKINDEMGKFIAQSTIKKLVQTDHSIKGAIVTVLGLTFKENCPDIRNTKVIDIVRELQDYGIQIQLCDPQADSQRAQEEYGIELIPMEKLERASALILAVAHDEFCSLSTEKLLSLVLENAVLVDVKGVLDIPFLESQPVHVWRL